jgi:muconate cycloisomerase
VKVAQSGGLYAAAQVAAIAGAAGIGLYGGTMLESSVGTAASAQLFVTFAKLEWETELFGPLLLTHEIVSIPLTYENFLLKVPKLPGLGLELDEERLQFFQRNHGSQRVISLAGAKG